MGIKIPEEKNATGFLSDLTAQIAKRVAKRVAVPEDAALDIAIDVAADIRKLWGGVSVYISRTDPAELTAKHDAIWEAYKAEGFSLSMIQRFQLSEQRIRQVIAVKLKERAKTQPAPRPLLLGPTA
jgi:Mor family transcriptional regulator